MDTTNVIDKLDALVNTSRKLPGTSSRLVDVEKVMELVEQLRLSIPQDIRAAQEVLQNKDSLVSQAQIEARRIRGEAEEEFKAKLDQHDLAIVAQDKADELISESERRADRMIQQADAESRNNRAETDAYIVQSLRSLERELTTVLSTVRKGLDTVGATVQV